MMISVFSLDRKLSLMGDRQEASSKKYMSDQLFMYLLFTWVVLLSGL